MSEKSMYFDIDKMEYIQIDVRKSDNTEIIKFWYYPKDREKEVEMLIVTNTSEIKQIKEYLENK